MSTDLLQPRTISSRAPIRIDLAGGTVDIWPLFLMLDHPLTVNVGIDLFADTELKIQKSTGGVGTLTLRSLDQKIEQSLSWDELEGAEMPPGLDIHVRLLRHFAAGRLKELRSADVSLSTHARSPAGAGLGGSSGLNISITGALYQWLSTQSPVDVTREGEDLIEIARDVETQVIKVPAGLQDYYGATFGGLQKIAWGVQRPKRAWLSPDLLQPLHDRVMLFYSGQSRNSGINNWQLYKDFIDRKGEVRGKFAAIVEATRELAVALEARQWDVAGGAIAREWEVRRTLAEGISTPEIDRAFEKARSLGASAGKICGAGGGGCFFVYLPDGDPARREAIVSALTALGGIQALPYQPVEKGLEIRIQEA